MRKRVRIGLVVGLLLALPALASAEEMMKPGLWEITTSMEMPGAPVLLPAQTVRHCYTAQEVKEQPVPKVDNCGIVDLKTAGNKVSWKIECKGEMAATGEGEIAYLNDSAYEGKTMIQTQGMTMTTKYQGKRIGECQ